MSLYRNCKLLFQHEPNQIDCKQTAEPPIPSSVSYLNNMRILYRPILELYDQCKRLETLDLMMLRTPVWTFFTLSLLILSRSLSKPILYTIFRWFSIVNFKPHIASPFHAAIDYIYEKKKPWNSTDTEKTNIKDIWKDGKFPVW